MYPRSLYRPALPVCRECGGTGTVRRANGDPSACPMCDGDGSHLNPIALIFILFIIFAVFASVAYLWLQR